MKNSAQDKIEKARIAREREMEALMVARSHAIEEEEMERKVCQTGAAVAGEGRIH